MTPTRLQLERAARRFKSAEEELFQMLGYLAEEAMATLASRFPTRKVEFHSGMGTSTIHISARGSSCWFKGGYMYSHGADLPWPDRAEIPAPDLWDAIRFVEESTDGRDPGIGSIIYDNGKRVSGLY